MNWSAKPRVNLKKVLLNSNIKILLDFYISRSPTRVGDIFNTLQSEIEFEKKT